MTIYTVMGANEHTEWVAKSFTCEQTAIKFLNECIRTTGISTSLTYLLMASPDPTIQTESVKRNLISRRINYTLHINELVTDAFMKLTLQPHKPRPFKEFL